MNEQTLDRIIAELGHILLAGSSEEFEQSAFEKIQHIELNAEDLNHLKRKLHNPPQHLPETSVERLGLGQWMAVCQYVIFELLYATGSKNIDFVKGVAFGQYDWTQATALEVLCRLTIEGKISKETIQEINTKIGKMRYETHLYFGTALRQRGKKDQRYVNLLQQIDDKDFQDSLTEIN